MNLDGIDLFYPKLRNLPFFGFSMTRSGTLGTSLSKLTKKFGFESMEEPIGWTKGDGKAVVQRETVEAIRDQVTMETHSTVYGIVNDAMEGYLKDLGYGGTAIGKLKGFFQFKHKTDFMVKVKRAMIALSRKDKSAADIELLKDANVVPLLLHQKEGLSLINGTQLSTAIAIKCLLDGELILKSIDIAGALSVENSFSSRKVFKKEVHQIKQHPGQQLVARNIYKMLFSSEIVKSHLNCSRVQDPYSFRCIPHVHGASRDSFDSALKIINNEINSVSDNPLVLKNEEIISSGHFHAEHIAQSLDFLSISFSELGSISERRIHFMMKGIEKKSPPFLALKPGLESGYMIAHVTAASLASENKTLSHPASVDNITTSAGQEDFVSMAPWAGQKLLKIQDNIFNIIAIELLVSGAANYISSSVNKSGKGSKVVIELLNSICSYEKGDRTLTKEIELIRNFVKNGKFYDIVNKKINLE